MKKFERLGSFLDEIVLFSVHKCYLIIGRRDVIQSLETVAMQGYFISGKEFGNCGVTHETFSGNTREFECTLWNSHKLMTHLQLGFGGTR